MNFSKINSKIKINHGNNAVLIHVCEDFNQNEAKHLVETLKQICFSNKIRKNILILPKKWKTTINSRRILRNFNKIFENVIVSPSPIRRAILKTEAVYDGTNPEMICCDFEDAIKKYAY